MGIRIFRPNRHVPCMQLPARANYYMQCFEGIFVGSSGLAPLTLPLFLGTAFGYFGVRCGRVHGYTLVGL